MVIMWRRKRGLKLFPQMNGFKVMVKTSERKQFSGTPCRIVVIFQNVGHDISRIS